MYRVVGCRMIEVVYVHTKQSEEPHAKLCRSMAVIDEEGKLHGKPQNAIGTVLYDNPNDVLVGTVVVLCGKAVLR